MTEYIVAFETTPYEVATVAGGFAVRQAYWDKIVSPVYASRAEADAALVPIARAAGCYRRVRFRKPKQKGRS